MQTGLCRLAFLFSNNLHPTPVVIGAGEGGSKKKGRLLDWRVTREKEKERERDRDQYHYLLRIFVLLLLNDSRY